MTLPHDEVGAHVSSAGGPQNTPGRAAELAAVVLQLFTKQPSRWAEPAVTADTAAQFREARAAHQIRFAVSHDSYLINLATSDPALFARSYDSFVRELRRCNALGLEALVTHPGNATGGDRAVALVRNAEAVARAIAETESRTRVLFEVTAGSGSALGASFQEIAALLEHVPESVGVCVDTCHLYAAGYDLVHDYDGVFAQFDALVGFDRLGVFHLNDSVGALGRRRDRHAHIGEGALGHEVFSRLMNDARFTEVPKLIETPKDPDILSADRKNIGTLRGYRRAKRSKSE